MLGDISVEENDYEQAEKYYNQAISSNPKYAYPVVFLYLLTKEFYKVINSYRN